MMALADSEEADMAGRWMHRAFLGLILLCVLIVVAVIGRWLWLRSRTIFDLLTENRQLRTAIANLTAESQIGLARVVGQKLKDGRRLTRVRFIETARDDPSREILTREYVIEGDVVHFDALIVKFDNRYVADGRERALYLWRRIYGETTAPASADTIEEPGAEPKRYDELLRKLSLRDRELFWTEIWRLSNDPDRLRSAGVQAIYGNDVYKSLAPGFLYVFKIANTGQFYLETVPAP
jgi:hypothetical protein